MTRYTAFYKAALAVILLMLAFAACDAEQGKGLPRDGSADSQEDGSADSQGDSTVDSTEGNTVGNAADSLEADPSWVLREPFFDFETLADLPEPPENYRPEVSVIPMTDHYIYYGAEDNRIYGPAAFIDNELNQVILPEGERDWYYTVLEEVGEDGKRAVYGYVIYIDGRSVYIDAGGSVFPDFYPEQIWGADMAHYILQDGYLITAAGFEIDNPDNPEYPEYRQLCGVMDLRTVQDVIPLQYDSVSLDGSTIWAIKGGEEFLYDYAGNLLMQSSEHAGSYEGEGIYSSSDLGIYEEQYRTLYLPAVYRHDGIVAARAKNQGVSFFSADGVHLLSVAEEDISKEHSQASWRFFKDEGKIIFRLSGGSLLVVYADGSYQQLRLPRDAYHWDCYSLSFEDGVLTLTGSDTDYVHYDSNWLITETVHEPNLPYMPDEYDTAIGGRPLLGADGGIIVPGGEYSYFKIGGHVYTAYNYLTLEGPFIMAYKGGGPMGNQKATIRQVDVLSLEGKTLLQDVLGANYRGPSFPGSMVVWLDETHSVLLSQNGDARPIPPYTQIEWSY